MECLRKGIQTKILNGVYDSPHSSFLEDKIQGFLSTKFKDVCRHYRDIRYSRGSGYLFECDFYIPSEDLFIEINAHPTHNTHPFDLEQDMSEYKRLVCSTKKWDKNVLNTWVVRDVEKLQVLKNNKLNYVVLYPTNTLEKNLQFNPTKYSYLVEGMFNTLNG